MVKFVHRSASASLALLSSLFLSAPAGSAALKCGIAGVTKQSIGTSPDCASIQACGESYMTADDGAVSLAWKSGGLYSRVDRATWDAGFENAYVEFNIPTMEDATIKSPAYFSQLKGTNIEFSTGYKFSEEEVWQKYDPAFGTSPYVGPHGILTEGFIAGVTIASIIVAVAIFSFICERGVEAHKKRIKAAVAMSIANNTMNFSGLSKNLSPTELKAMFVQIDADGNGNLWTMQVLRI